MGPSRRCHSGSLHSPSVSVLGPSHKEPQAVWLQQQLIFSQLQRVEVFLPSEASLLGL